MVKSLGAAIHDSWIRAVIYCSPDPTRHRAVATGDAQHMLKLFQSLDALHPSLQNNDMLGALTLCKHMARLAEGEFQCLLSLAPQGNPRNLTLTMARGAAGSNIPISVAHEASPAWLLMSRTNSRFDGWPLLDAHTSERSAQLDFVAIGAHASLVAEERNDLLPEMFRSEQFASKEGIQVLRELLGRVRENRLGLIQTARRLLGVEPHGPVEIPVSSIKPFEWPALGNELSKIEIAERWRTYHESKRLATELPSAPTPPSLQLIKAERFPLFESSVQRLIETRMVPAQQEGLEAGRTSGGILNNYYDSEFWRTFFASGGTLVARLDPRTAELLGFMAYAAPRVPRHLEGMALHGALPIPAYVSHAELAVVAHNAPPQTLDTLLHAMLLDLVIQGAEASRGVTYTWNQRALSALTRRGHHAFDGEPLVVQSPLGSQAMVPMWWYLNSRA